MACGSNQYRTVLAAGSITDDVITELVLREKVRVLHLTATAQEPLMEESDKYKKITGSFSDRIMLMAIFLQYDFPMILCDEEVLTQTFYTVCREQWHGEYSRRSLLIHNKNQFYETDFSEEQLPVKLQARIDNKPLYDMLLK